MKRIIHFKKHFIDVLWRIAVYCVVFLSSISLFSQELIGIELESNNPIRWTIYADTVIYDGYIEQIYLSKMTQWRWEYHDDYGEIIIDSGINSETSTFYGRNSNYTIRRIFPSSSYEYRIFNKSTQIEVKRQYGSESDTWLVLRNSQVIMEIESVYENLLSSLNVFEITEDLTAAERIAVIFAVILSM